MRSATENRREEISNQILIDLQAFILNFGDSAKFADVVRGFPTLQPATLVKALVELEKESIISFSIKHNALIGNASN